MLALSDTYSNLVALNQWLHLLPALVWLALTLFLPFGFFPLLHRQDTSTQIHWYKEIVPQILRWLKVSAALTVGLGVLLFLQKYGWGNLWWNGAGQISDRGTWVIIGVVFGLTMAGNLWFGVLPSFDTGGERRERGERLCLVNAYLAGPTTVAMVAPNNYGAINGITAVGALVLGLGSVALLDWSVKRRAT